MLKSRLLLGICLIVAMFVACEKVAPYDEDAQLAIDDQIISTWLKDNAITMQKDDSGVYYNIIRPGTGTKEITLTDVLLVQFEGRMLGADSVFLASRETDTSRVVLDALMPGWQKIIPKIKAGGAVRMIVPSKLAYRDVPVSYGTSPYQNIIPNSILDFTVNVRKIEDKKVNN